MTMQFEYEFDGLMLKVLNESNAKEVLHFYERNKEEFNMYESTKPENFYTENYMINNLRAELNAILSGSYIRFFLFSSDIPDKILGTISFSHIFTGPTSSCILGYKIDKDYRRLGLATSMINKGLEIIRKDKSVHRIEAYIHPDNKPSLALINKLGFIYEGTAFSYANIGGSWQDHERYVYIS